MKWEGQRQSRNVRVARGAGTVGLGGIVIAVIYALMGGDPRVVLDSSVSSPQQMPADAASQTPEQEFVSVVLADTEDVWNDVFRRSGLSYVEPKLVLFSGRVDSACGLASAAVGPFYCPNDQQVYLDLAFFHELQNRLGAQGDFARAYVIAHEIGHHVQNLLGIMTKSQARQQGMSRADANAESVKIELQADCLAGLWAQEAQRTKAILEQGDLEEAMNAAQAVGDDRLQKRSQGYVVPDSFTHGTSAQRMASFKQGYTGDGLASCDVH